MSLCTCSCVLTDNSASSAKSMPLMVTYRTFLVAFRRARFEAFHPNKCVDYRYIPSVDVPKAHRRTAERITKRVRAKTQPCLKPLLLVNSTEDGSSMSHHLFCLYRVDRLTDPLKAFDGKLILARILKRLYMLTR